MDPVIEFNPDFRLEVRPLPAGGVVLVLDDVLRQPEQLVAMACARQQEMVSDPRWQYPGRELVMPATVAEPLARFFRRHCREHFQLSRVVREAFARLSMVTLPPSELSWVQRMCHTDAPADLAGDRVIASVLYLFHDETLGGTAFFRPREGVPPYHSLLRNGVPEEGASRFGFFQQPPAYHTDSNEFFERVELVPARWNRIIFYPGDVPHSGHIQAPERLTDDPSTGRLTLNGFYRVAAINR